MYSASAVLWGLRVRALLRCVKRGLQFNLLVLRALVAEYGNKIEFEGYKDIDVTGNFEITLMQTKQIIHSKTRGGLGKCETEAERKRLKAILDVYMDYLKKKESK